MKRFSFLFLMSGILLFTVLLQGREALSGGTAVAAPENSAAGASVYLPVLMGRYDSQFPAPLFGMQMYGSTHEGNPYYPYLIDSQTSWIRIPIQWGDVEPEDGDPASYNWTSADNAVAIAAPDKGGLHLIAILGSMPEWATLLPGGLNGPIAPEAMDDFADFVHATVERYDGDGYQDAPGQLVVRHWELFNEPDGTQNRWGGYGTEYAAMLEVAYEAIKTADPQAQVLFGGVAHDWFEYQGGHFDSEFLDDVFSAGGGEYFDVMNFHMYPLFASTWGGQSTGLKEKTAAIRAKMAEYGLEKPIVVTEAGWHSSPDVEPASSHQEQIARLVQLIAHGYAADIKVLIWFMIYDPGFYLPDYGLVTNESSPDPKPAYTAYQTAVELLESARFVREIGSGETGVETMEAYQFSTPDGPLYIAWINPYSTEDVYPLRIPAAEATILNGQGTVIDTAVDGDGDGAVNVNVTAQPIYIQVTQ